MEFLSQVYTSEQFPSVSSEVDNDGFVKLGESDLGIHAVFGMALSHYCHYQSGEFKIWDAKCDVSTTQKDYNFERNPLLDTTLKSFNDLLNKRGWYMVTFSNPSSLTVGGYYDGQSFIFFTGRVTTGRSIKCVNIDELPALLETMFRANLWMTYFYEAVGFHFYCPKTTPQITNVMYVGGG